MSLQVWLPLNGDLKNLGLNGSVVVSNNGAIINDNGKIGKCYSFNGNSEIITSSVDTSSWKNYSICCWIKADSAISDGTWHRIGGVAEHTFFLLDMSNKDVARFFISQNGTTSGIAVHATNSIVDGSWHHLCGIADNTKIALYIDGELIGTTARTIIYHPESAIIRIGNTYSGSKFKGLINDFRIYDHALSTKEVKELAKGLVLHYPLNKPMPNLLSKYVTPGQANPGVTATAGRTNYLGNYSILIPAAENADTYFRLFLTKELIQNNKYTFSCYVSGLKKGTYYNFPFFALGNTGMGVIHLDHNGLNTVTFTMNSSRLNAITDPEGKTVYIMFMDDSERNIASGLLPFLITLMKLEEGEKATAWIPNESDPLYAAAGYASGIVYDCSGYLNNGIEVGTITGSSDTPRYRSSEFMQSSDPTKNNNTGLSYIKANIELTTPTAMTVSWWAKPLSGYRGSTNHAAWCTSAGTEPTDYNSTAFHHRDAIFNICPNSSSTTSINLTFNLYTANEWHHYVIVYDGLKAYAYKDAILISSVTVGSSITPLKSFNKIFIGFSKAGGAWRKTDGYYSDFRVYCTALSANDIKALYEDAGYIDKNGNFHAYEFVEE